MKTKTFFTTLTVLCLLLIPVSCKGEVQKTEKTSAKQKTTMQTKQSLQKKTEAAKQEKKTVKKDSTKVDENKIYEQNEVKSAVCPYSNPELAKFVSENARYDNPEKLSVSGFIIADLIIEKNGVISDVIIVEGLHPSLDKDAIKLMKLLPKFTPGTLKGNPVRSKYQMVMAVKASSN